MIKLILTDTAGAEHALIIEDLRRIEWTPLGLPNVLNPRPPADLTTPVTLTVTRMDGTLASYRVPYADVLYLERQYGVAIAANGAACNARKGAKSTDYR